MLLINMERKKQIDIIWKSLKKFKHGLWFRPQQQQCQHIGSDPLKCADAILEGSLSSKLPSLEIETLVLSSYLITWARYKCSRITFCRYC